MDLTVDHAHLSRALRLVGRVVPNKASQAILQHALLEADLDRLRLTATDGELLLTTTVAADVAGAGRTTVAARLLGAFVTQLPGEPLRFTLDSASKRLRVACGPFVATFATLDPDDFLVPSLADAHAACDVDAERLRGVLGRVAFAAARDDSRPVLTSVLFEVGVAGLTVAAVDGFRLAQARLSEVVGPSQHLLVPARAVREFNYLLAGATTAQLALAADGRTMSLITDQSTLITHLSDGRFPDLDKVIPQDWRTRVTVDAAAFRQAVSITGLFGAGEVRPVRLDAIPGRLRIEAHGDEAGAVESELAAVVDGEPQTVLLNTRLLSDLLDAVRAPLLELHWAGPQTPVVVRETERPDTADLWVVMPLNDPTAAGHQTRAVSA